MSKSAAAADEGSLRIALGQAVVPLESPWRFHTGDNRLWAEPSFDDSTWETVDLTAPAGAHDPDVGLEGYVPGWQARGHGGYFGFAWYRIRVSMRAPKGETLGLLAPFYVDSAYQVFLDGRLLGGAGDFSGRTPVAYNSHLPKLLRLPPSVEFGSPDSERSTLVAVRVWMGPWALGAPDAGGMHIAPALGTTQGVAFVYRFQWIEMIRGYIVDAVEALLFLLLAVMACSLIPFDRGDPAYVWLAAALILIALRRANQAVFFWWQFETVHEFELVTVVLLIPLTLAAWTLAWCTWLRLRDQAWMAVVVGALTLTYSGSEFSRGSWFYGVAPHWVGTVAHFGSTWTRFLFAGSTLWILLRGIRQSGSERWYALPAILLISVGLFAQEWSMLHVPGVWFPFGTGVSRTQYAYAAFDAVLFVLLLRRLYALRQLPKVA